MILVRPVQGSEEGCDEGAQKRPAAAVQNGEKNFEKDTLTEATLLQLENAENDKMQTMTRSRSLSTTHKRRPWRSRCRPACSHVENTERTWRDWDGE